MDIHYQLRRHHPRHHHRGRPGIPWRPDCRPARNARGGSALNRRRVCEMQRIAIVVAMCLISQIAMAQVPAESSGPAIGGALVDPVELEIFMDGAVEALLEAHDVAGGTVSVVKDGEIFFAKGYGLADAGSGSARRRRLDQEGRCSQGPHSHVAVLLHSDRLRVVPEQLEPAGLELLRFLSLSDGISWALIARDRFG